MANGSPSFAAASVTFASIPKAVVMILGIKRAYALFYTLSPDRIHGFAGDADNEGVIRIVITLRVGLICGNDHHTHH